MDQFYSRLQSAKTFIKLTANLVVSNFVPIILLYLVSTVIKIVFRFLIFEFIYFGDFSDFSDIISYIPVVIDLFFINVIIAYMVRCYSEDVAFDFRDAFMIIIKNIIAFIIFISLLCLFFVLVAFAMSLGFKNPSSFTNLADTVDNAIYILLILIFVVLPVCTWVSIRFGYFTHLMGLYDVSLLDALSGSFQITKHMVLKIIFLNICLFWEIGLFNYFAKKIMPSILIIIISSIFTLFYAICNSFIALNLVCLQEEDEDYEEEKYKEEYSENKKVQTYIDTNNYFDYNTDNNNMGESNVGLLGSTYDVATNDSDVDPWRYSN